VKIALIADIHGNLPALERVMEDIERRKADKIFCLGDMVGKGANSRETMDIRRKNCDVIVRGNWEMGLYEDFLNYRQGMTADLNDRVLWFLDDIGEERLEYFGTLPHSGELYLSGRLVRFFHAHPLDFYRYFPDSPIEKRRELFGYGEEAVIQKESDVAIYADIHGAFMQTIDGKILLNTGSVGNPLDMSQASYVVIEGEESREMGASFDIQFVRIPYEIDRAVRLAKERKVPDLEGYIAELTEAKYFKRN